MTAKAIIGWMCLPVSWGCECNQRSTSAIVAVSYCSRVKIVNEEAIGPGGPIIREARLTKNCLNV